MEIQAPLLLQQWRLLFFTFNCVLLLVIVARAISDTPDFPCKPPHHAHPFCNASLSLHARAASIVSLLTLREKAAQLSNGAGPVARLGLPAFQWWSESLHGLAGNGPGVRFNGSVRAATSFPQVLLAAAALNRSLWFDVAAAVGVEARAMYNVGQAGLTYWAPNINVFRDPRWGRGQETPGEDPALTAAYAVEYVKGFQGLGGGGGGGGKRVLAGDYQRTGDLVLSACCKHFTAYDLDEWGSLNRYLTSDCDAVSIIYEHQTYTPSAEDSVADVWKAGMDINCGTYLLLTHRISCLKGKLSEKDIDRAL